MSRNRLHPQRPIISAVSRLLVLAAGLLLLAACDGGVTVEEDTEYGDIVGGASDPGPAFLYAASSPGGVLQGFLVDPATGSLTEVAGSPWAVNNAPMNMEADPTGSHLYVVGNGSSTVTAFAIDRQTGALSQVGGPVATNAEPLAVAVHPNGNFVFVTLFTDYVQIFSRDAGTGALSSLGLSPGLGGSNALDAVVHPNGAFLYLSINNDDFVDILSINQGSGALASVGSASVSSPDGLRIDPSGNYLYVGSDFYSQVEGFSINPGTGALASLGGPYTTSGTTRAVAFDATGTVLIASEVGNDTVYPFLFNSGTGALTGVTDFTSGSDPIAIEPCGGFIYVANEAGGDIAGFSLNPSTGVLTETAQDTISVSGTPLDIEPVGCN